MKVSSFNSASIVKTENFIGFSEVYSWGTKSEISMLFQDGVENSLVSFQTHYSTKNLVKTFNRGL